jgi:hypothetical protein
LDNDQLLKITYSPLEKTPITFRKTAEAYYEHQKHFLPILGIDHGLDTLDRTTKLRKSGLQKMISSAYNIHELWSVAHEQIVELRRLEIAHCDQIRDDFPLPEPLLIAFLRLYIFLGRGCNIFGQITATIFMTSIQSRRHLSTDPRKTTSMDFQKATTSCAPNSPSLSALLSGKLQGSDSAR